MRQTLILAGICALAVSAWRGSAGSSRPRIPKLPCGRSPTEKIVYWGHSAELPTFTITRAAVEDGVFTVYVQGPRRSSGSADGPPSADWKTADGGGRWEPARPIANGFSIANGLAGQVISGIGSAMSDPRVMYLSGGFRQGAISRSTDAGLTWKMLEPKIGGLSPGEFATSVSGRQDAQVVLHLKAIDPQKPMTVYAGVEVYAPAADSPMPDSFPVLGLYVSRDGGGSWRRLTTAISGNQFLGPVGIFPLNPRIMYGLSDENIVMKSIDGGLHWAAVGESDDLRAPITTAVKIGRSWRFFKSPTPENHAIEWVFDPRREDTTYFVSEKGVYVTLDGGRSWRLVDLGFDEVRGVSTLVVNPLRPDQIFVAASDFGIFRSDDGGCHFADVTPPGAIHRPLPPPIPSTAKTPSQDPRSVQ